MSNILEYSKKLAVVAKLHRKKMITDSEYLMIRNRLKNQYNVTGIEEYKPAA